MARQQTRSSISRPGWTQYRNLAKAYDFTAPAHGLSKLGQIGPRRIGIIPNDHDERDAGLITDWTIPWHRNRDESGLCRSRTDEVDTTNENRRNTRWVAEGGRLTQMGGQASPAQKMDLARAFRLGLIPIL